MITASFSHITKTITTFTKKRLLHFPRCASPIMGSTRLNYSFAKKSVIELFHKQRKASVDIKGRAVKIADSTDPNHFLLAYFMPPQVQILSQSSPIHIISQQNVCTIVFLQEKEDSQPDEVWQKRKRISISSQQMIQLLAVSPNSHGSSKIINTDSKQKISLLLKDMPQTETIEIQLESFQSQNDNLNWQMSFALTYEDYRLLKANLRHNFYHVSGAAMMLEVSKEHQLYKAHQRMCLVQSKVRSSSKSRESKVKKSKA